MTKHAFVAFTILIAGSSALAQKKGVTVDDMLAMQRISEPATSPDGKLVAFTVRDTDIEANRGRTDLWIASTDGTTMPARRLTTHPDNDSGATWSSDGKQIYFTSSRGGSSQVWRISAQGGEAEQVTKLPLDVNGFKLFPDDKRLVVALDVWPDAKTLDDSVKKDGDVEKSKVKVRAYDQLLFRHWDQWEDGKYSHLFVWSPSAPEAAVDVTPGLMTDAPSHPFGGMEEVAISPDGKTLAYVARLGTNGTRDIAWTTNTDVFVVSTDGKGKPTNITAASKAYDFSPTYSPDGKTIAWLAMQRPGYEADRQRIALYDVASKKSRVLTEATDRSFNEILFSNDGKTIFSTADNNGHHSLYAIDAASGNAKVLVEKGTNQSAQLAGDRVLFSRDTLALPAELFTVKADGSDLKQVTKLNADKLAKLAMGEWEQFTFKGAKGDTVSGFVMHPANHNGTAKVPVAMLIHGGPQGSFGDHWHYRWNPQAYAGRGYGVVFIDFHGSTGYGQAFTDAIRHDWGGAPYEDLMMGLDAALAKYKWLDGSRAVALGASYGGYMINWINGQTDRFKALVCHDGNLDERMAYFDTEELWFPEWEHGGPPWENAAGYTKHNPIDHISKWKTPTLVIHGGNDFRVVDTQGMSTFTALQRRGIASRFLHFPDENHWVLKPQNSKRWHEEVLAWLDRYSGRK
jgi:dipeptidyl aminopeptidase/acylaminoacyl peptidase